MLDLLPFQHSMKRLHRVRRFRHGNAEHKINWSPRRGPRHHPTKIIVTN